MREHIEIDEGVRNRARGALIGQACGDALGTTVEFQHADAIARVYPRGVRDLVGGGPFRLLPGQVTDDTELALSLARSLVRRGGFDDDDVAASYVQWCQSGPFDVGGTTSRAFGRSPLGRDYADRVRARASMESQANGSLMRQSPLGVYGWRLEAAALSDLARRDSTLSHPHPVCQEACVGFTFAIARAVRTGEGARAIYEATVDFMSGREAALSTGIHQILLDAQTHNHPDDFHHQMGWVKKAFQNAFYQFLHADSLEEGVIETVRLGGDTDTNGCIAGALMGAVFGASAVPERWVEVLLGCRTPRPEAYWCVDLVGLADALVSL